jgi:hypothetical protein
VAGQDFSLRVRNITPFDAQVKLLYTGDDDPNFLIPALDFAGIPTTPVGNNVSPVNSQLIGFNYLDKVFREIETGPANWGASFPTSNSLQNADGTVWVSDGKTLPYAFNTAFTFGISFILGPTLVSYTVNVTAGMPIDKMLQLSAEGIRDELIANGVAADIAQLLGNATPPGMLMNYEENTAGQLTLNMRLQTCNNVLGNPGAYQNNVTIGGQTFNWSSISSRYGFNIQEDGWTKWIDVTDRSGTGLAYIELVNSLANQSLLTDKLYKYSNNSFQVNEPLEWKKYDATGDRATLSETGLIDPYQAQPAYTVEPEVLVDGQVYAQIKSLAGEYIDLTFYYDTAGILNPEQIEALEEILREEGRDDMNKEEEKELNKIYEEGTRNIVERYSNFSGISLKDNSTKVLLGIVVLLLIFRNNVGKE